MRHETERMQKILQSPSARRMIDYVSPIYGEDYVALWLFEIMGRMLDSVEEISESLWDQTVPQTATWALPLWEEGYGITPDPAWTVAQRQANLLARIQYTAPVNPAKLANIISAAAGVPCEIVENVSQNTFFVRLRDATTTFRRARAVLEEAKPAHLIAKYFIALDTILFQNPTQLKFTNICVARYQFYNVPGGAIILLDGHRPLDGSWMLGQDFGRLWMVRVGIRTWARMPHLLGPAFLGAVGGIGVRTEERTPLNLRTGAYAFDNMGGFVRLDGREKLDGTWLLDQRPWSPGFIFRARVRAAEPQETLRARATHIRAVQRTEERIPLRLLAGVYPFVPNSELLVGNVFPRYVFQERKDAPLFQGLVLRSGWETENRIITTIPVLSLHWRNEQTLQVSKMRTVTSAQERTGAGVLKLSAGIYQIQDGGKGLGAAVLHTHRLVRFNGAVQFDGSQRFNGKTADEIHIL